jgi:hypothetical protein
VLAGRNPDPHNPQAPKLPLTLPAIAIGKFLGSLHGLLGGAMQLAFG